MPNKERLPLFITKLVSAKMCSGAIKIEFNAGSEEVHTRYLSRPYAKELAFALLQLLAKEDTDPNPPFDDLRLEEEGETLRFTLLSNGVPVLSGSVTKGVAEYAHKWLTKHLHGPNVELMGKAKKRHG